MRHAHTISRLVQLSKSPPEHELYDVNAILKSPFHLCLSVPERNFPILPREAYPWAENRRMMCRSTGCASPRTTIVHSSSYAPSGNRWTGAGNAQEALLEMPKNKEWILLIPESEDGACVCVDLMLSPSSRCCSCSESWDALDEDLSDGEWSCPITSSYSGWGQ